MLDFASTGLPLTADGVAGFVNATGSGEAELWSVLTVETRGAGFLPDKRPKILFERHKFSALTGGRYDASHPSISLPSKGGYGEPGSFQYIRLAEAIGLDRDKALKSASWGIAQIMGLNYASAGFATVEAMVAAMSASEDAQLGAMTQFLISGGLNLALRQRDWAQFAAGYNGADYAANNYDGQLAANYYHYTHGPMPSIGLRRLQLLLTYQDYPRYDPRGVDGMAGRNTTEAIARFRADHGLPAPDDIAPEDDPDLLRALGA